jgi:glucose/arabinose dehydrogenase
MIATLGLVAVLALPAPQEPSPPRTYELVPAFPGQAKFDQPLYIDHDAADPDGLYVVEQGGTIHRIPRDPASGERVTFLDWTERVITDNWEEGLLGFAFDPDFAANGFVYIDYSQGLPKRHRQSVIARLHVDPETGRAEPESELVLLTVPQPYGNHNGGTIVFGPDGMLYIALGDGGLRYDPHDNAQNPSTLLGAVLRIDVRGATAEQPYRVPEDNPFVGRADGDAIARGEIWAYGLRNPWRIAFDRETGDLWCGDVGQNTWEEVDRIVRGGNYGWNHREGFHVFEERAAAAPEPDGLIPPVVEYGRDQGGSVTGGYVYRGGELPELTGRYVYGDFISGRVWAVREDRENGRHEVAELCRAPAALASFGELPDGELLVLCYDGVIYRLRAKG